jgi:hypothetical protein
VTKLDENLLTLSTYEKTKFPIPAPLLYRLQYQKNFFGEVLRNFGERKISSKNMTKLEALIITKL